MEKYERLESLWGDDSEDDIIIKKKEKTKKALEKISKPKKVSDAKESLSKTIKSKTISLEEKLKLIKDEVLRVLGKQKDNVIVIRNKEDYIKYIQNAIETGTIAIDTETNNSLDPITCKLMGLCLYYPNAKQAYIPVNHRDWQTKERLDWQLTEQDIKEGLELLLNASIEEEFHNGKFDIEVLKCTCNIDVPITWDTMIGAKLIDENEYSAGLKQQYIDKIDPDQEKYSIDHLFEGVEYADVDPEIFALYAATDSLMTYKLDKEYQEPIIKSSDYQGVLNLATETEIPLIPVLAEMELNGMKVDQEYAQRLSKKFHKKLDTIDSEVSALLKDMSAIINEWKLTPNALNEQMKKQSEKQRANAVKSANYDDTLWTYKDGIWYKKSKSKLEQLDEELTPNSLASPTQLAIVLYDILKAPIVNQEKPAATGEEELKAIAKISDNSYLKNLCSLMLERREVTKLLSTYIDTIPELAKRWPDGRVRTHFNQYGAATGRLSSSDPINFQNIPSHEKSIRLLFRAEKSDDIIAPIDDNVFEVKRFSNIETINGWKSVEKLTIGDVLLCNNEKGKVIDIKLIDNNYQIKVLDL